MFVFTGGGGLTLKAYIIKEDNHVYKMFRYQGIPEERVIILKGIILDYNLLMSYIVILTPFIMTDSLI